MNESRRFNIYPYLTVVAWFALAPWQVSVMPLFRIRGIIPDLFLPLVVGVALLQGGQRGALWGIVAGLAIDLVAHRPLGSSALIYATIAMIAGRSRHTMFHGRSLLASGWVFVLTWLEYTFFVAGRLITGGSVGGIGPLLFVILLSALYNAFLMWPLFFILRLLEYLTSQKPLQWG